MIENNVIKFGYGDISVGNNYQYLTLQQFKPPGECGNIVSEKVEYVSEKIYIEMTYEKYRELTNNLEKVLNRSINSFTCDKYVFDFTNFNAKSIRVIEFFSKYASDYLVYLTAV